MIRSFFAAAVLTVALASSASADFVFTTIGTSGSPSIANGDFLASGRNISSGGSTGIPVQQDAMKFTPTNNYTLTSYELALVNGGAGYTGGNLQILLLGDIGNSPDFGNQLDSKFVTSTGATEQVVSTASAAVTVNAGTSYWLFATFPGPNQAIVWATGNKNISNVTGPISGQVYTNPPPNVATGNLSGFRVQGDLIPPVGVPEPSSFALAALGVGLGMGSWGWRRRAQKAAATV